MTGGYRLGVLAVGGQDWFGGLQYTNTMLRALASCKAVSNGDIQRIDVLIYQDDASGIDQDILNQDRFRLVALPRTCLGRVASPVLGRVSTDLLRAAWLTGQHVFGDLDLIVPAPRRLAALLSKRAIPWIPDFQHCTMPELFSSDERAKRQRSFGLVLRNARTVILSSEAAHDDAKKYFDDIRARIRVLHFFVDFPERSFLCDPAETLEKYNLNRRYLFCGNQFWAHKNHGLLFEALAAAKAQAPDIQIVCSGRLTDDRDTGYFEQLLRQAAVLDIMPNLKIFGFIPRHDQLQILRGAHAVVQPSLSEGWSTLVEEARCFDKPILLSDIGAHVEQAPPHAEYFEARSRQSLTRKLLGQWNRPPHISPKGETLMKRASARNTEMGSVLSEIVIQHLNEFR